MKEYIKKFLDKLLCAHDWEEVRKISIYSEYAIKEDLPIKIKYLYKCKKCGKLKVIEL